MRITLSDIEKCSQCPAYYHYSKNKHSLINKQLLIAQNTIKKAYVKSAETRFRMTWRTILNYVDKQVFKEVDFHDKNQFKASKSIAEHILSFLQSWYNEFYLKEDVLGYCNVPIEIPVGSNSILAEKIPIILLTDPMTIFCIGDVELTAGQIYNNIRLRGLSWLVSKIFKEDLIKIRYIWMGKYGGYKAKDTYLKTKDNYRAGRRILEIVHLIENDIKFPSFTESCNKCIFFKRCIL